MYLYSIKKMLPKLSLVTGVSQGIGNHLLRQLLQSPNYLVIGTVRNSQSIKQTLDLLHSECPDLKKNINDRLRLVSVDFFKQLNSEEETRQWLQEVTSDSIKHFGTNHQHADLLINNAGVMQKVTNFGNANTIQGVKETLKVNFMAPLFLSESLIKSITTSKPLIVNLGARVCTLSANPYLTSISEVNDTLRKVFESKQDLTVEQLYQLLMEGVMRKPEYLSPEQLSKIPQSLPDAPYLVSKVFLHALTKIEASSSKDRYKVVAVDPGWVKTRLGGSKAPLSPEKSAQNIFKLVERQDTLENGLLYSSADGKVLSYV